MTADQRMFINRHYRAFSSLIPDQPVAIRRATARVAYGIGITAREIAWWFDVSVSTITDDIHGRYTRKGYLARWREARRRAEFARRALRQAEGAERAAAERARIRGLELPEVA